MSTALIDLTAKKITFAAACRENTGRALCDSGDHYGRHYEEPVIPKDTPAIVWEDVEWPPTLVTAYYLDHEFEIDKEMQKEWEDWNEINGGDLNWFESAQQFMSSKKYTSQVRDNTYNSENDLSQDFVYEVFASEEYMGEALYADDDCVTVIHIHCGCDVRGGYGRPLFCRYREDYTVPVDPVVGFQVVEVNGDPEAEGEPFDREWEVGYSSNPWYSMIKDIVDGENGFSREEGDDNTTGRATLLSGEKVIIQAVSMRG